jgi:hypothetical protein
MSEETENPIVNELEDKESIPLEEAYERLYEIMDNVDDGRDYLRQLHLERKTAVASDAMTLAALPVDQNGEAKDYPAIERHSTDAVRRNGDGESLENVCTHQTDHSGPIEAIPSDENPDEFPDVAQVYPDVDEKLRIRVNEDLLKQVLDVVSGDEEGVILSFCRNENEDEPDGIDAMSPIKIEGTDGVGLVMPMRMD